MNIDVHLNLARCVATVDLIPVWIASEVCLLRQAQSCAGKDKGTSVADHWQNTALGV